MRRKRTLLAITALAATAAALTIHTTSPQAAPPECQGQAFPWGGDGRCWSSNDGDEFAGWLNVHGSSPARFAENWPQLAAVFREPWPPLPDPPYWKTCDNGKACAAAVIQHVFGGDISYEMQIVGCETGWTYHAGAVGSAGERGWWQIHPVHFGWLDESRLFEPLYNTVAAYRLSEGGSDFTPWTCA